MKKYDLLAIFFLGLFVFWFWSPPSVTMEDSGEFIIGAATLGVMHPPGYPMYTRIANLFSKIPLGNVAERVDFFNHICGAIALLAIALIVFELGKSRLWAATTAAVFGLSRTFWFQSACAEVYALNTAEFLWIIWLALKLRAQFTRNHFLWLCFLVGLCIANHWPIFVLNLPGLAILLLPIYRKLNVKILGLGLLLIALPQLIYLDLYYRSQTDTPVNFLGPMQSMMDLVNYFLRKFYAGVTVEPIADLSDYLRFQLFYLRLPFLEFFPPLMAFFFLGVYVLRRERTLLLGALLMFCATTWILHLSLRMEYRSELQETVRVFQLIPLAMVAIFMGIGSIDFVKRWPQFSKAKQTAFATVLIISQFGYNFKEGNLRNDTFAFDYANLVLQSLPPNSLLLTQGDADTGPIAYANLIEKIRPDIEIRTQASVFLSRRTFDPQVVNTTEGVRSAITELVKSKGRIFSTRRLDAFVESPPTNLRFRFNGFFYEVMAPDFAEQPPVDLREPAKSLADKILEGKYATNWPGHRDSITGQICNYLVLNGIQHGLFETSLTCRLILAKHLHYLRKFEQAIPLFEESVSKITLIRRHEYDEMMLAAYKNKRDWIESQPPSFNRQAAYQQLVDFAWPAVTRFQHCKNKTIQDLMQPITQYKLTYDREMVRTQFTRCKWIKPFLAGL